MERIAEAGVARREGGRGKERARLKVWITCCNWVRTWWRVRRWERAGGSCGLMGEVSMPFSFAPVGCSADSSSVIGAVVFAAVGDGGLRGNPSGTNLSMASRSGP